MEKLEGLSGTPRAEDASADEDANYSVRIHWTKNGFSADPKDILGHPNAKRQLKQAREWLAEQRQKQKK